MATVMYLIRHGATEANLARPALLQGRRHNPSLAAFGIKQAELTRDFLAVRPLDYCYCSPLLRALETASIIAQPHGLSPQPLDDLIECDVGEWEGMDWQTICRLNPDYYSQFMEQPGDFGYPSGESFAEVYERTSRCLDTLLSKHAGKAILVVAHHVVNRTFLAGILGLSPNQARHVTLDNCGISMITREADKTTVTTLNAAFHLQGIAA